MIPCRSTNSPVVVSDHATSYLHCRWHCIADMEMARSSFDSAPARSLLFFVVDSVCMCECMRVCMSVTLLQIDSSSLFLDGIEPFLGHQFSMTKATKRCSSNLDLLPWQRNLGYFRKKIKLLLLFGFSIKSSYFLAVSSP